MELLDKYLEDKYSSFDVCIVKDEKDPYKSYVMLDGYVISTQVNVGAKEAWFFNQFFLAWFNNFKNSLFPNFM